MNILDISYHSQQLALGFCRERYVVYLIRLLRRLYETGLKTDMRAGGEPSKYQRWYCWYGTEFSLSPRTSECRRCWNAAGK